LLEATFASWRVGGDFIDSRSALDDRGTPIDTTQVNEAELLQAYAAWNTKNFLGSDWSAEFKGRRQTIDPGYRRLVARNSFRNTINTFTGLNFMFEAPGQWQARSFFVLPVTRLPDTVSDIVNDEVEFDEESFNTYFGACSYAVIKSFGTPTENSISCDEPGTAKRRRRARDSRVSGVKSLCELARDR
jgi:hypothetical protein